MTAPAGSARGHALAALFASVSRPTWSAAPLFGVAGLLLAPLFMLGSLEFVGAFESRGWRLAGFLVPLAYVGWSFWLLALGIALLVTA